jgi:hypothetical protein
VPERNICESVIDTSPEARVPKIVNVEAVPTRVDDATVISEEPSKPPTPTLYEALDVTVTEERLITEALDSAPPT